MKKNKYIQCCYCKANKQQHPFVKFFNVDGKIAHGCGICKAIANNEVSYETT